MGDKDQEFYNNEVFAQAEVVQHPKEENSSALILNQSFHLLSNEDMTTTEETSE
ncbi:hypothetical protein JOC75_002234 [Metabacillus crassostreae]|uniref:transcriptional regulator SplA domain-containing protein n=1 Tax=Metabacillus crassostreae TaxID=929098 RepID=UPI00195BB57C|nr:transcriptional regulator SplA domain-containing protein [Metabacillus crassostreae]MBM7604261.1 hypothetical protein [Metabacillus crassostreae]